MPSGWPTAPPIDLQGVDAAELLSPYAVPQPGWITVATTANLAVLTSASPAGSTFWLAPGTHDLPGGEFAQVVPKNGNRYIGAPGARIDGGGVTRYCFTQHATDVVIEYLEITGFNCPNDEGVVNHDQGDRWTISRCYIHDNGGGALMGGDQQIVEYCLLKDNGQYGINWFKIGDGMTDAVLRYCEIVGNNQDNLEFTGPTPGSGSFTGCGCTGGVKFWAVEGAHIHHNYIHDNLSTGVWADTNDIDFLVEDNWITGNFGVGFFYEISFNAVVRRNYFADNANGVGQYRFTNSAGLDYFPDGAIYLSEAGGDSRVGDPAHEANGVVLIEDNYFRDNWDGVVLWENADRFSLSPANTSSGYCTPMVTAMPYDCDECADGGLLEAGDDTYYDLCRWKTNNVTVRDNWFRHDADATGHVDGARQAIISNYGTFPAWSPYDGTAVQQAITFEQNNVFEGNVYEGDWQFQAFETTAPSLNLSFDQWQTGVVAGQLFTQDVDSTATAIGLSLPAAAAQVDDPSINWQPVGGGFTVAAGPGLGAGALLEIVGGVDLVAGEGISTAPPLMIQPEPLTEVTLTCQPWVDQSRLGDCVPTASASQRQQAVAVASDVLFALSGRQWPGVCSETVRPCSPPNQVGHVQHLTGSNTWVGWSGCGCGSWDDCACGGISYVQLRRDAIAVTDVTVDGESVTDWRLLKGGRLLRLTPGVWPCCQDLTLDTTEVGTWAVTYTFGAEPPIAAAAAAEELACELARSAVGLDCALPERVTSVTRQGVSFNILDPQDFLTDGRTGVYAVDLFLQSVNPARLQRRSSVWWPGRTRLVREGE